MMKAALAVLLLWAALPARADTLTLFTQPIVADPSAPPPTSIGVGIAICDLGCYTLQGQPQFTDNIVFGQVTADDQAHTFTASSTDLALLVAAMCPNDCPYFNGAPSLFPYFSFDANGQTTYWGDTWGWGSETWNAGGTVDAFSVTVPAVQSLEADSFDPSVWLAETPDGNQAIISYSIEGQGLVPEPSTLWLTLLGLLTLTAPRWAKSRLRYTR